jgi:hypothetical protein
MRLLMKVNDARFKRLTNEREPTEREREKALYNSRDTILKREKALRDAMFKRRLEEKTEIIKEMCVAYGK